jgi:hypothetical protein
MAGFSQRSQKGVPNIRIVNYGQSFPHPSSFTLTIAL